MDSRDSSPQSRSSSIGSSSEVDSLSPLPTTHSRSTSTSSSSSLSIIDFDFPMPPPSRYSTLDSRTGFPADGISKSLRLSALPLSLPGSSPLHRLLPPIGLAGASIPISPSFDPSKPPQLPLPPLPPPSANKRFPTSPRSGPPQIPLPPLPSTPNPPPTCPLPPLPRSQLDSKPLSSGSHRSKIFQGLAIDTSRTLILNPDQPRVSAALATSWSSSTLLDQTHSDLGPASTKIGKTTPNKQVDLTEINYGHHPNTNEQDNFFSKKIGENGDEPLSDLVNLPEEEEVQAAAAVNKRLSGVTRLSEQSSQSIIVSAEQNARSDIPRRYDTDQLSTYDLSQWARKNTVLSDDEEESEIDLDEPLDGLAKRLGYQAPTDVEDEEDTEDISPPLSPSMIINSIQEESDYSLIRSEILLTSDDPLENVVMATEEPALSPSSRTVSCSSNSSLDSPVQPLITPLKPASLSIQRPGCGRFSLTRLDFGCSTKASMDLKRSASASFAKPRDGGIQPVRRPKEGHSRQTKRQLPMKVIEEPSSSDEEEFDLSLDHREGGDSSPSSHRTLSLMRSPSLAQIKTPIARSTSMAQLQTRVEGMSKLATVAERRLPGLVKPKPSSLNLAGSFKAKSELVSKPRSEAPLTKLRSESVSKSRSGSAPKPRPLSGLTKPRPLPGLTKPRPLSGLKPVASSAMVPSTPTRQLTSGIKETKIAKPTTRLTIKSTPGLSRTLSYSSIPIVPPSGIPGLSLSTRSRSSLPPLIPSQSVRRSASGPIETAPSHPLGLKPPPGKPGSLERRQWLCAGLAIKPVQSNTGRFVPASSETRPASLSMTLEKKVGGIDDSRRATTGGWDLEMMKNVNEDETLVDIELVMGDETSSVELGQSEAGDQDAGESSGEIEENTKAEEADQGSSVRERRLKLKPLWLSSLSALPEDDIPRTPRTPRTGGPRASLPLTASRYFCPSTIAATVPYNIGSTSPVAASNGSIHGSPTKTLMGSPLGPAHQRLAHQQLLNHRRSMVSLSHHHRASVGGTISIRQLAYY